MSRRISISGTSSKLNAIAARRPLARAGWALAVLAALLLLAGAAIAAIAFPALTGRVVDQAELLSPQQEAELTRKLEALQRASTRQLVVATVSSLQDNPIEDYGYQLGRAWHIGQQGANNGVILLVAPNEKRVRIEVGYGLEPVLPDALASQIIQQQILPRFRANDYPGGIAAGADAIIAPLQAPPEAAERAVQAAGAAHNERTREHGERRGGGSIWPLLFWIGVVLFVVIGSIGSGLRGRRYRRSGKSGWVDWAPIVLWGLASGSRRGRRRGWDDWGGGGWGGGSWGGGGGGSSWGGGGGGGFSGGGGSFGGGGASGGW
jgi:uncharacterized protein